MVSIINASLDIHVARWTRLLLVVLFVAACASPGAVNGEPDVNFEGLADVRTRSLDIAQVRPGTDFSAYTGLLVSAPELAFRTPDRSQLEFPLDEDQKQRFREMLSAAFQSELAELRDLQPVDQSGQDVLELRIRVQDILATVPPRTSGRSGRAGFALEAVGQVTLVLELRDSRSHEILARGVDMQKVEGAAIRQQGDRMLTRWEEVEDLCAEWASIARRRLDALTDAR